MRIRELSGITDTKDLLKSHMKTYYFKNFIKFIHLEMKLSHNRGDNDPTKHQILPNKLLGLGNGLHMFSELLLPSPKSTDYCQCYW